ncbi:MBL fold metallo-hydrolase [Burkholderia sp. PU8-34]
MTSLPDFIYRTLGFAAVERGRAQSAASPQHDGERFRNVAPRPVEGFGKMMRVMWNMLFNKPREAVPAGPVPVDSLTREQLEAAPDRSLYRLGHSTLLIKLRGEFWLTDPVFAERASPFRRVGPRRFHAPPIALADLPPLRGVILSHDHYDHLDRDTVLALAATTGVFVTPLGVGDRLIEWGIDAAKVRQLDWWQSAEIGGLTLTATPAQHFSGRSLFDGNSTLWASWVIADEDLRGRWLVPIHNGTFDLAMHRWQEPFERVTTLAVARGVELSTPRMGERLDLTSPHRGERWWRKVAEMARTQKSLWPAVCASRAAK